MSVLKRLSTTFFSRVEQMVGEIENHDAVIESTIQDARQAVARAKVRLERVRRDGERLCNRDNELRAAVAQWEERAKASADTDKATALACVKHRRECRQQQAVVQQALAQHAELEARLIRDIRSAEDRLNTMTQQRNLMRTRQSAAEALQSITGINESFTADVDDAFERWEIKVTEAELATGSADARDPLERRFEDQEEQATLQAELRQLIKEESSHE